MVNLNKYQIINNKTHNYKCHNYNNLILKCKWCLCNHKDSNFLCNKTCKEICGNKWIKCHNTNKKFQVIFSKPKCVHTFKWETVEEENNVHLLIIGKKFDNNQIYLRQGCVSSLCQDHAKWERNAILRMEILNSEQQKITKLQFVGVIKKVIVFMVISVNTHMEKKN